LLQLRLNCEIVLDIGQYSFCQCQNIRELNEDLQLFLASTIIKISDTIQDIVRLKTETIVNFEPQSN